MKNEHDFSKRVTDETVFFLQIEKIRVKLNHKEKLL